MRNFCTIILFLGLISCLSAQNNAPNFWTPVKPESVVLPATAKRVIEPVASTTFRLDVAALNAALQQAPMEFTAAARQEPVTLSLPLADGAVKTFRVWESPVMAPELAAKFPAIRTYAGQAADGSGMTVRLGVGYKGFHAFLFQPDGHTQTVRPYAEGGGDLYMCYRQEDLPADPYLPNGRFECGTNEQGELVPVHSAGVGERGSAPVTLKKYRAAISTQAEYSLFHGGTKPLVMSAIVEALNFIVAIQERDFAVRLELIPNNDTLIYFDPATDPYSGDLVTSWMQQNPAPTNSLIGVNNYDIGHVFCRVINTPGGIYVAGQASLGGVCTSNNKARAGSSLPSPVGEGFYGIIVHEMGHQFSATHTFNSCPPSADALTPSTAFEPGSGSTIMSYAGTCDPDNVQFSSDDYFHVSSIEQAMNFIANDNGNTCGEAIVLNNNFPEVNIPFPNNLTIPFKTPFFMTANASDADGDALTYCWEEFDLGPNGPLGQPTVTAPAFRSLPPNDSPWRVFPRLSFLVSGQANPSEVLPTYTREFNFKVTVRDGHSGVAIDAIKFFATEQAGPFRVTDPNLSTAVWNVGEYQTITWDVANTDKSPINCKIVDIYLSHDNGLTYPDTLARAVPNTGKYCLQVPNVVSNTARVRIQAADHFFFDISNATFKIQAATQPGFSICTERFADLICAPTVYSMDIATAASVGFSDAITLSASGLPAGATATFSPNPVSPGSSSTLTIDFGGTVVEGSFDLTIQAAASSTTKTSVATFKVVQNDFSALALQTPANGAQSVDIGPWLYWNGIPDADKYEVQVATNPSFEAGTIIATNANIVADSFKVPILSEGQIVYWRVRALNECGVSAWTDPFVFVTKVQNCASVAATDLPKNISSSTTPTVESTINIANGSTFSDVNVKKVQGNHEFMKDLEVTLVSPAGTTVQLFKDKCGSFSGNFNIGFDDSAGAPFGCPPPNNGSVSKPAQPLSVLNGQNSTGAWKLRVKDNVVSSGGQLTGFELEFCSSVALNPPFIVNNNTLQLMPGTNAPIGQDLLKADDANNGPTQLLFTLLTVPAYGDLRINGAVLEPGSQFTQDDLNNGLLRYYEWGFNTGTDHFLFSVTDGEGGLASGSFLIQPFPTGTQEPAGRITFGLAPNPASESLRLFVTEALDSDSRVVLYNPAGQQLRTWMLRSGETAIRLDVSDLPEGVYAVSVENAQGRGVKKVVIQ